MVVAAVATHHDLPMRDGNVDADSVGVSFVLMVMGRLDHHPAADDGAEQLLELAYSSADLAVD
jgi:hypothetical protein